MVGKEFDVRISNSMKIFLWICIISLPLLLVSWDYYPALADDDWTGRGIMEEVRRRHDFFPYVFEVQSMILTDSAGNRDARMIRRFSRIEQDGTMKLLLVLDNPKEVRGVALRALVQDSGDMATDIYLPAFGKEMIQIEGSDRGGLILGTDFTVEDLISEELDDFQYIREEDEKVEQTSYFVVTAIPKQGDINKIQSYSLRRHLIRKDIFYIIRTDYYDRNNRVIKQLSRHDLKQIDGHMWRANMVFMENHKRHHKTLLKVIRRIFSEDYVLPEMFTSQWLFNNRHFLDTEDLLQYELQSSFQTGNMDTTND